MSASIGVVGAVITLTGDVGETAIAQSEVTTAAPNDAVSFKFNVSRRAVTFRVGTTAGAEDIVQASAFAPGDHVVTFTPGVGTYYVRFEVRGVGVSYVTGFARIAPGFLELPTPWTASQVPQLRFTQSLNTMWIAGAGKEMHVFERRGTNSWSLRPFLQVDGPFNALNLSNTTLTPSARTGAVTITASASLFATYDVGSLIKLIHSGQFVTADLDAVDAVTDSILVTGVEATRIFQRSITGTFSGTIVLERSIGNDVNWQTVSTFFSVASGSFDDDLDNVVAYYRFRMSAYTSGSATASLTYSGGLTEGVGRIVTVTADNAVTVDVITPFGQTIATALWQFGAWSGRFGHPTAVALFDGRLWAGRGNQYWGSQSDDFGSFEIGPLANQAIGRSFGGRMSSIRWLGGSTRLLAGLSGFEGEIGSNSFNEVLKPDNVRAINKTTKGSADASQLMIDDAAVFVSRSKKRLYRFGYSNQIGDMSTVDLTRLNKEIAGAGGFRELDWQQEPEPRIWAVREDGQVGALVFDLEEGVVAWCRMVVDGFVESVCCLPSPGEEDEVYFVVRRTVDGDTVRYVEKLAPEAWDTIEDAWRLHCAIAYSGAATDTVTGLDHLEGRTDVYVWANGREEGPLTVTGGEVTLSFEATYAIAGLKYSGRYKSGRLAWGAQMGSALTTKKQLEEIGLVIHRTAGGALKWGPDFDDMEQLDDRIADNSLVFDASVQEWSGDHDFNVHSWTEPDVRLHITMDTAGPATVLAVAHVLKVNG
jgi:hypothetical protein